ncbi:MAG: right-handed parallel beta-helix repeat-containing protein [Acidobacteriota bacterium]
MSLPSPDAPAAPRPMGWPSRNLAAWVLLAAVCLAPAAIAETYYVSSSSGDDAAAGTSPGAAFRTLDRVAQIELQPGDTVRLLCGDVWRVEPLHLVASGTAAAPIVVGSHPPECVDRPVLSGARPISGWTVAGPNLYRADLSAGANAGLFPAGVNQLFRDDDRLPLGRWPNLDGHPEGGYSIVDASPSGTEMTDASLPAEDWRGAVLRLKGIRWYLLNRLVTDQVGQTLTVEHPLVCFQDDGTQVIGQGGDCAGWGYYLTDHPATLDREGEWFFDSATHEVVLFSLGPPPADGEIEASVVLETPPEAGIFQGAVTLGARTFDVSRHIAWVTVENLHVERWFEHGITFPENLLEQENSHLTLRGNVVRQVDGVGLNLRTWVPQPAAGTGPVGWRGGRELRIENNVIEGANNRGIYAYSVESEFVGNEIRDIALLSQLGRAGMGCGFDTAGECTENGDGLQIASAPSAPDHTARANVVRGNRLEEIGMNGIDVYGRDHLIEHNVIDRACVSKGDCGGIRVYGRVDLASTPTHDVTVRANVVRGTVGNVDGVRPFFDYLFGFGIYVDNWTRDIVVERNVVTGSSWVGIMFQLATGVVRDNLLYDNVATAYGSELSLIGAVNDVDVVGNVLFPIGFLRESFRVSELAALGVSDDNRFFSPYDGTSLWDETLAGDPEQDDRLTLAEWQAHSGRDAGSSAHWYTLDTSEPPRSRLLVNASDQPMQVPLVGSFFDLDQIPVAGSLDLAPFSGRILIEASDVLFRNGFESGDVQGWSSAVP